MWKDGWTYGGQAQYDTVVEDYKELRVYRRAFETSMLIFELSGDWPSEEKYALVDQIRRSSRSVCANIGEAWFKRRYPKHFVSKLSDAASEATETLVWVEFAQASGYLPSDAATDLEQNLRATIGGLVKMMARPEPWCGPSDQVRENSWPYDIES